jgi:hypothetical protein
MKNDTYPVVWDSLLPVYGSDGIWNKHNTLYKPNTVIQRDKEEIGHYSSQYTARLSAKTKQPSSEPRGAIQ